MRRVVSLYLPTWPTDRFRRMSATVALPDDRPLVMAGRQGNRRIVMAMNQAARKSGARMGMAITKVQAIIRDLSVENYDAAGDRAELERLALWFLQIYSPVVAADPPDGLVLDTTGADHLHGTETRMLHDMRRRLHAAGIGARVAIADTRGAAHGLARYGSETCVIVPPGKTLNYIGRLPIPALRLDSATVAMLKTLGFRWTEDLLSTPRAPLTLRFGPDIVRRLDQATGALAEPIEPVRAPEFVEVSRIFAEPISAPETIARYTSLLVQQLFGALETKGLGARRMDLVFHRVDSSIQAIRAGTAKPVRDIRQLTRLLTDRIDTIDPAFGIEKMVLTAIRSSPLHQGQTVSSLTEEPDGDVSGVVDLIANRGHRIYRYAAVASDVPERSVQKVPALAPDDGQGWHGQWPRPARLFATPEPIVTMALLPDNPPVSFIWRGVRHTVRCADGPERIFGEWWRRDREMTAVRDYFAVENEAGERFWIFRSGDGEHAETGSHGWFIHGIFA